MKLRQEQVITIQMFDIEVMTGREDDYTDV